MAERNSRLAVGFTFGTAERPGYVFPAISTEKIDRRNRDKVGAIPTFCPFCGVKYREEATAAPEAVPAVAVKGLEWKESPYRNTSFVAPTGFGENYVAYQTDEVWRCVGSDHATLQAAQAAAQADYEARIRSALAPATRAVPDTLEALRNLETKAIAQKSYFNDKQHKFPSLEDFTDTDGNLSLPHDISPLLRQAEANGRYSEADWWLSTIRSALDAALSGGVP
ncbi:hypothetical protein RQ479_08265 [Mesorhizobium sp. ISC25]|uniref:hypothetical protein n=1 Tax=Mesorhizobium sp. ISC25 TaxID=3077335 RepID=UPI0035D78641